MKKTCCFPPKKMLMNWRDEALVVFLVQIRELGQFPRVKLRAPTRQIGSWNPWKICGCENPNWRNDKNVLKRCKVADLSPIHVRKQKTKPQMLPYGSKNIGETRAWRLDSGPNHANPEMEHPFLSAPWG